MKTSSTSTESKTDSQQAQATTNDGATGYGEGAVETPAESSSEEVETDDLGYETPKEETPPAEAKADDKPEDKKEESQEKVEDVSGYGDEEKPEEKPEEKKETPEQEAEVEKKKKEISETLKDLGAEFDKEKISAFALENNMTKEQVAAYAKFAAKEAADLKAAAEAARIKQRNEWKQDLQKDPTFGGANFDANVARINKFLEKNLPETKKMLTEKKGMLPPYIMKDLLGLVKAMNPTNKFSTGGEPPAPEEKEDNSIEEFYS